MTDPVVKKVWVKVGSDISVEKVSGLIADAVGWRGEIAKGETVVIYASGFDDNSRQLVTGVRSFSPPNSSTPTEIPWVAQGDAFVSPPFGHGSSFRMEVDTSKGEVDPIPSGGGYFRIVEEGGG
jgi:hypothetical protein